MLYTGGAVCTLQSVPREVAAAINPIVSDLHRHNTMEEAADLIERMGLAAAGADLDVDQQIIQRLHHQLAVAIASALRYEVAQELKAFPVA